MAIWQYTFYVVPKESFEIISNNTNFKNDENEFDDAPYWIINPVSRKYFFPVSKILKKRQSWSSQIDLYGNEESTCFNVFFENNHAISVFFRIDFTSNYEKTLSQILEFCILSGLVVLDENLSVIPLNMEQVKNVIDNSPQLKKYNEFLKNK